MFRGVYYNNQGAIIHIVTGVEVTIGNCFPDVWEILPDAEGGG